MTKRWYPLAIGTLVALTPSMRAADDEGLSEEVLLRDDETSPSSDMVHNQSEASDSAVTVPPVSSAPSLPSDSPPSTTDAALSDWKIRGDPRQSEFRGNWLKKRRVGKQARALYEKLHDLVVGDWEKQHKEFAEATGHVITTMKQQRQALGVDDADIVYVVEHVGEVVEYKMKQDKVKFASRKEPLPQYDQAVYVKQLEELRAALKELDECIGMAEQVSATATQQMPLGASYEQEAWQSYEAIDDAYDDRRAEELFLAMESQYEHLNELMLYLQRELTPYTQRLLTLFEERLAKVQAIRDALAKEAVPLRPSELRALKEAAAQAVQPPASGWFGRTMAAMSYPFVSAWNWLKSWF